MKKLRAAALLGLFLLQIPASAHHPFATEFDWKRPLTIRGMITRVQWTNPHVYIFLDARDDIGARGSWTAELGPPRSLQRYGLTPTFLKPGDMIAVDGWAARNGDRLISAKAIILPSGREIFAASSFFDPVPSALPTTGTEEDGGARPDAGAGGRGQEPAGTTGQAPPKR